MNFTRQYIVLLCRFQTLPVADVAHSGFGSEKGSDVKPSIVAVLRKAAAERKRHGDSSVGTAGSEVHYIFLD